MFILDTNVVSELMKPVVSVAVETWCASQSRSSLYISTITQAEILYGIAILPDGTRQQRLQNLAQAMFQEDFLNKILPFSQEAAQYFAIIASDRKGQGKPISQFDAQIAAICRSHKATLATRNTDDFADCGIDIINPWEV